MAALAPRTALVGLAPVLLLSALALAGAATACAGGGSGPMTGAELYRARACHTCHGGSGEGRSIGPPLVGLAEHWTVEDLAAYLAEPRSFVERSERLQAVDEQYRTNMQSFRHLDLEERTLIARWVLGLEP